MAFEGGEHHPALPRLVTVLEKVAGHASNVPTDRQR
jgi:hypothetical protein